MIPLFKVFMHSDAAENVADVLNSGYIGQGEKVEQFEHALKAYMQSDRDIITVNSATSAIDLALHMIGVGYEDEVISTPITCTASNSPTVTKGGQIAWADIDPNTGLIDPASIADIIHCDTKAIIAVNWGGRKPDYNALKAYGLPVIEDAAHGPYVLDGNNGDYIVWSFQAIKFLTTGDGGALYCPDTERARLLRWYGLDRRSSNDFRCQQNIQEIGYKYHLNDINASIGLSNLPHLDTLLTLHKRNALRYVQLLRINKPPYDPNCPYWIYTIFADREIIPYLAERGIASSPVHARNDAHDAFRNVSLFNDRVNVIEYDKKQINIPVGWWVRDEEIEYIASVVNEYADMKGYAV
jgi:dTDP-4-amino-4,6-dideoxygalactose transaminase